MTTFAIDAASPAHAQAVCPVPVARAIDEVQKILKADDHAKFGIALACMTQALAQTRSELEALRDGRIAFTGQVNAPKGVAITRPSRKEGD